VGKTSSYPYTIVGLLAELRDLRDDNKKLRRRVHQLEESRDRWKKESRAWQWGAMRWRRSTSE
jgi:hypothetical protein